MKVSAPNVLSGSSAIMASTSRPAAGSILANYRNGNPKRNFSLIQIILYWKRLESYVLSTISYTSSAEPEDSTSPICMPKPIGRELLP